MASVGHDSIIAKSEVSIFDRAGLPKVDLQNINFKIDSQLVFTDVEKVIALSNVHGQFGILNQLLLAKKVIDGLDHYSLVSCLLVKLAPQNEPLLFLACISQ